MENRNYKNLGIMLVLSSVVMYGVMFLNVDSTDHIYLSLTRLYMTLLMVSPMSIIMLYRMKKKMYPNKTFNTVIIALSSIVFILSLLMLRTQTFVSDTSYMKAMIPHHSSAILTSKNADIKDPELQKLAQTIIEAQEKEIRQMKAILKRLDQ